ncbi:MAG: dihydrolipoyl dehydrogenase [Proteobacteria bacterium]|nr:dihydrolipoyl dehydrogenase [Pseudomonadota bacterium]TDJ33839.1 MAG: dihydrolipoyl dehydrogenase [Gammaproteobacteria bacterium]
MTTHQVELVVPELGDFSDVEVIEVLVEPGDEVAIEESLITLETDKASMDVPSTHAGKVSALKVKVGDKVNAGDVILTLDATELVESESTVVLDVEVQKAILAAATPTAEVLRQPRAGETHSAQLVVIGSGPGGYTAAFRAADLGLAVILVERYPVLGGVCLNVGCIPSKALLHAARVIDDVKAMAEHGVKFGKPQIDVLALRGWKNKVVEHLTSGLTQLAKQRKVTVIHGVAKFASPNRVLLDSGHAIEFENCIIAAGSESAELPGTPDDPRIVDSTGALELDPLPKRMLVVGGGIIGLEMACVYSALGTKVSVVELTDALMPGTDPDLVRPFRKIIDKRYESIMLDTKVIGMLATVPGIEVAFEGRNAPASVVYDRVLISVGRRANGDQLDCDKAGVSVNQGGIIPVNKQMQTNVPHIFAIGDLVAGPMLAHKASHEAKVAAEVAAGMKSAFDARTIPSVAYTDPEIAWVGLTETDAKRDGISYEKTKIPWAVSGRALALGRVEGFTKLLFDKTTGRVIGGGIVGVNAGDLIAEVGLAIEMGADATDIGQTIHPHPTLSETIAFAAEAYDGTLTDLYLPKKR